MKETYFRHYGSTLQEQARDLRKNLTIPERKLWFCFLKEQKPKFSCQKVIGSYIVDFFCSDLMLAIELDGEALYAVRAGYVQAVTAALEAAAAGRDFSVSW